MRRAIKISCDSVGMGGGPFGAVVVSEGQIVGEGRNEVVLRRDPSAHAEMIAIREACRNLDTHVLNRSVIYTSCEPCPMCLGAIWWARIQGIYFGNSREDAALVGFDDSAIYEEVSAPISKRRIGIRKLLADEASVAFELWAAKSDKVAY